MIPGLRRARRPAPQGVRLAGRTNPPAPPAPQGWRLAFNILRDFVLPAPSPAPMPEPGALFVLCGHAEVVVQAVITEDDGTTRITFTYADRAHHSRARWATTVDQTAYRRALADGALVPLVGQ